MLRSSEKLTVININGTLHVYSNKNDIPVPIGIIDRMLVQDFGIGIVDNSSMVQDFCIIEGDDDEYIIIRSSDNISIHSWRRKLRKPAEINELFNLEKDTVDFNQFTHIEFKDDKTYLQFYYNGRWITKICDGRICKDLFADP